MRTQIETVTPDRAKRDLENPKNDNYRNLDMRAAHAYAEVMRRGEWEENGESISYNCDGSLVDGQTRLMACVLADVPFTTVVVYGVVSDANINTGRKRLIGDLLKRMGEKNVKELSGALGWLVRVERGQLHTDGGYGIIPHSEYLRTLKKHPGIRQCVEYCKRLNHSVGKTAMMSMLLYQFRQKDAPLADWFVDKLDSGAGLGENEPVYRLRERFLADQLAKAKLRKSEMCALAIIAWNTTRQGRQVKNLRWIAAGRSAMEFPTVE